MGLALFGQLIAEGKYTSKTYTQNEIIHSEECFSNKLYLIKKGIVKLCYMTKEGQEIIPVFLSKDMIFGADVIFGDQYVSFTSESICDTIVYVFEMNNIHDIINKNKMLHRDLLLILKEKYFEVENRIRILNIRSAEQRLLEAFIEFKGKFGYKCQETGNTIIELPFDQDDLGKYIRVTRVTVCTIINSLKCRAIIDYSKNRITLKKEKLHQLQSKSLAIKMDYA